MPDWTPQGRYVRGWTGISLRVVVVCEKKNVNNVQNKHQTKNSVVDHDGLWLTWVGAFFFFFSQRLF